MAEKQGHLSANTFTRLTKERVVRSTGRGWAWVAAVAACLMATPVSWAASDGSSRGVVQRAVDYLRAWQPGARSDTASNSNLRRLVAANGTVWPQIDGVINPGEWDDASVYTLETSFGETLTLYVKVVPHDESGRRQCPIYPDNPDLTLPCDDYLLIAASATDLNFLNILFDEGDDGGNGSGSGDGVITVDQEDFKWIDFGGSWMIYCDSFYGVVENCPEPACVPWEDSDDCWKCGMVDKPSLPAQEYCYWGTDPQRTTDAVPGDIHTMADGYAAVAIDGYTWPNVSGDLEDPNSLGYFGMVSETKDQAELIMPFHGREGDTYDRSDATFAMGDTLNVYLNTRQGVYPRNADSNSPALWIPLQIGGTAEVGEDFDGAEGCSASRVGVAFPAGLGVLPLFGLGLAFIGIRRRR